MTWLYSNSNKGSTLDPIHSREQQLSNNAVEMHVRRGRVNCHSAMSLSPDVPLSRTERKETVLVLMAAGTKIAHQVLPEGCALHPCHAADKGRRGHTCQSSRTLHCFRTASSGQVIIAHLSWLHLLLIHNWPIGLCLYMSKLICLCLCLCMCMCIYSFFTNMPCMFKNIRFAATLSVSRNTCFP
jgi:hypothetical protein